MVSIGNDMTSTVECKNYDLSPQPFEFKIYSCPPPGVIGNVIRIKKNGGGSMTGNEVQPYGKHFFNPYYFTNNTRRRA